MEWMDELGTYAGLFPGTPALAVDMMSMGLPGATGAVPAALMQTSPESFDPYPGASGGSGQ